MKLSELLESLDTMQIGLPRLDVEVGGVHNDTRRMKQNDLFVAIKGAAEDGHTYIQEAIKKGASLIVTEEALSDDIPHVIVPDSHIALARLAACFHGNPAESMVMIGVTGTNGKTTVTHIIKGILEAQPRNKVGLIGTNSIMMGDKKLPAERTTPDAVSLHGVFREMADAGCTHCVMEVSSHALAQNRVHGIRYDAAVFTNLRHEHLDYHHDMETYFEAKSRLFLQSDVAVVNIDDEWGRRLLPLVKGVPIRYSTGRDEGDVVAKNIKMLPGEVEFEVVTRSQISRARWNTPGMFSVSNALAAISCGLLMSIPLPEVTAALSNLRPVKGRMETVPVPAEFSVLIDYAHTPDALENVLSTARGQCKGRLIALFGCGGDRDTTKRPLMGETVSRLADIAIVTSDNPRTEDPERIIGDILSGMAGKPIQITDRREAIYKALSIAEPGDIVMLCGKGHEDYQEINRVKNHFDEREVVSEYWIKQSKA